MPLHQDDGHKRYYWLMAQDPDSGKQYLVFGGATETEARERGLTDLGGVNFEIKALPTRNLQRASSLWKGQRLGQTHDIGKAAQRLGHNKSISRLKHKHKQNPW